MKLVNENRRRRSAEEGPDQPVALMVHGAPGARDGEPRSLLRRFFAGDEDQEFADDLGTIHIVSTDTVADPAPAFVEDKDSVL